MSETWGPRGHPERCDDEFEQTDLPKRQRPIEEILAEVGVVTLALVCAGLALWLKFGG